MPNWNELLNEVTSSGSTFDVLRRKYVKALYELTKRNVIVYYSGWLQKPGSPCLGIDDEDKNGFMSTINKLDRSKGLDLILHTPGGEISATESLVDYLHSMFETNIRAFVPQLAMSGGTMIACACNEIWMGKHSSLGPVDPQINGIPAHGIMEEFEEACKQVKSDLSKIPIWQPIIAKYSPALIGECQKAITWSEKLLREWLAYGMFRNDSQREKKIGNIALELGDHALTLSHARHLSADKCKTIGLTIKMFEEEQALQEAVLSLHHSYMLTFSSTPALKIIENQEGVAFIKISRSPTALKQ